MSYITKEEFNKLVKLHGIDEANHKAKLFDLKCSNSLSLSKERPSVYKRHYFLREVDKIVCKDKNSTYGEPEESFQTIAEFWNVYFKGKGAFVEVTGTDVALMLDLMKTARLCRNPTHLDSYLDKAGYSACAGAFYLPTIEKEGTTNETTEAIKRHPSRNKSDPFSS